MDYRKRLLWIDGSGGLLVGVLVLASCRWIASWHNLPMMLIIAIGIANAVYGCYSLSLAMQTVRPLVYIHVLVVANLPWAVNCFVIVALWRDSISILGVLHIAGEGIYVGALAILEWRWRHLLVER